MVIIFSQMRRGKMKTKIILILATGTFSALVKYVKPLHVLSPNKAHEILHKIIFYETADLTNLEIFGMLCLINIDWSRNCAWSQSIDLTQRCRKH